MKQAHLTLRGDGLGLQGERKGEEGWKTSVQCSGDRDSWKKRVQRKSTSLELGLMAGKGCEGGG